MRVAYFTKTGTGRQHYLDLCELVAGRRHNLASFRVDTKKEAREVAKSYGAKPWNF